MTNILIDPRLELDARAKWFSMAYEDKGIRSFQAEYDPNYDTVNILLRLSNDMCLAHTMPREVFEDFDFAIRIFARSLISTLQSLKK